MIPIRNKKKPLKVTVGEMRNFTDLKKLHTFSIGFEEKKHDESHYINLVKA